MNEDVFLKWVDALKSSTKPYKYDTMRRGDKWSPLAILCESIDPKAWEHRPKYNQWYWNGNALGPDKETCARIGLSQSNLSLLFNLQMYCDPATHAEYARMIPDSIGAFKQETKPLVPAVPLLKKMRKKVAPSHITDDPNEPAGGLFKGGK